MVSRATKSYPPSPACRRPHSNGIYFCTLVRGHSGPHKHAYSGPLVDGWRRGTIWG